MFGLHTAVLDEAAAGGLCPGDRLVIVDAELGPDDVHVVASEHLVDDSSNFRTMPEDVDEVEMDDLEGEWEREFEENEDGTTAKPGPAIAPSKPKEGPCLSDSNTEIGTWPRYRAVIDARQGLIEYQRPTGTAIYAGCPECRRSDHQELLHSPARP